MKLISYESASGGLRPAVLVGDGSAAVDLERAASEAELAGGELAACADVRGFLGLEPETRQRLFEVAERLGGTVSVAEVRLGPPIPNPEKILCIGLNYLDHAKETRMEAPATPIVFGKFANSLVGPTDDVVIPPVGKEIDYEAELAVVIGSRCARVDEEHALDHVFGAMAFNDVSARDLQMANSQWMMGKAIDTFGPCGPALVSLDEVGDLQDLAISARVNGVTVQDSNTSQMIFGVAATIAYLSSVMTLLPGDIIATGTPAGVGMGQDPPLLLGDGDLVEVEVERVGSIRNRLVAEAPVAAAVASAASH